MCLLLISIAYMLVTSVSMFLRNVNIFYIGTMIYTVIFNLNLWVIYNVHYIPLKERVNVLENRVLLPPSIQSCEHGMLTVPLSPNMES